MSLYEPDLDSLRTRPLGRRALLLIAAVVVSFICASCVTPPKRTAAPSQFYERPSDWSVVSEKEGDQLYQVNLQSRRGSGRILLGKMSLKKEVGDVDAYLNSLHTALVDRIRGQADVAPFSEDLLRWDNGMTGYRTKLRGELSDKAIIIEGMTLSDGEYAYFQYGLFRETDYEAEQDVYQEVLASLAPLRGASLDENTGMDIAENESAPVQSSQAADISPDAYQSPETHLGLVEWGTTREDIVAEYGQPIREGQNAVGYPCNFLAIDNCVVIYMFTYGQLTHGGYLIEHEDTTSRKIVAQYLKLTSRLAHSYGRPVQSAAIWADPQYRDQGRMWGKALEEGHVVFGSVWNLGPTKLVHSLKRGRSGGTDHRILLSNDTLRQKLQQQAQ